jgi:hypothetical protein
MAETIVIPWYATGFRADVFGAALNEVAAASLRYGALAFAVYRSNDDRYRFQQFVTFADHLDWERYWEGPDMVEFRTRCSGWYQVPVAYASWEPTAVGGVAQANGLRERGAQDRALAGKRNGHGERTVNGAE